jgi:hypothetical protein
VKRKTNAVIEKLAGAALGLTNAKTIDATVRQRPDLVPATKTTAVHPMLTVEHEAAEILRLARLRAYAAPSSRRHSLGWFFRIFGLRTV